MWKLNRYFRIRRKVTIHPLFLETKGLSGFCCSHSPFWGLCNQLSLAWQSSSKEPPSPCSWSTCVLLFSPGNDSPTTISKKFTLIPTWMRITVSPSKPFIISMKPFQSCHQKSRCSCVYWASLLASAARHVHQASVLLLRLRISLREIWTVAQGQIEKGVLSLLSVKWCVQMTDSEERPLLEK